jgi:integrase
MLRRNVRIDRQLVGLDDNGLRPRFGPPKTPASNRMIPLPQVVVDVLSAHLASYPPLEGLVFAFKGMPLSRQRIGHVWRPVALAAGLPPGTGLHVLRHHYASLLIRHGESVKTVQGRLGHASAVETLDTYSHLWPDSDDRMREAVDAVLRGPLADSLRTAEGSCPCLCRSEA